MKRTAILILLIAFCLFKKTDGQTLGKFGPLGAKWLYENEGVDSIGRPDTVVKYIRITTDTGYTNGDPFGECHFFDKSVFIIDFLKGDSSIVITQYVAYASTTNNVIFYDPRNFCSYNLYYFNDKKNYSYTIKPIFFPGVKVGSHLTYPWYLTPADSITINGHRLAVVVESSDSASKNNSCGIFCSPIIQHIGSLGFMFPIDVCFKPFRAGRLISYYDPDFGYWKVPDSLRNMACSYKYVNASVNDPFPIKSGFKIYPNPASNLITIESYNISQNTDYELYNIEGQKLLTGKLAPHNCCEQIDVQNYPHGMYLIRLKSGDNWQTEKIVIEK